MKMYWNELHKKITQAARDELAEIPSLTDEHQLTLLTHRIASRACEDLLRLQQYLEQHDEDGNRDDSEDDGQDTFHIPTT